MVKIYLKSYQTILALTYQILKMNKPLTVLIDLDSTIYDLLTPWLEWYNRHYNDTLQLADIDRWSWNEICKPECGTKLYSFLNKKGLFTSLKSFPSVLESIEKVHKWLGVKQVFCSTIIGITGCAEKLEIVKRDFPYLGKEALVLVGHDKSLIKGDILVDDGPHNLEAFRAVNGYTVLANMQNVGYCKFPQADVTMTRWQDYPMIIRMFLNMQEING